MYLIHAKKAYEGVEVWLPLSASVVDVGGQLQVPAAIVLGKQPPIPFT
jgi:hypothetical protein